MGMFKSKEEKQQEQMQQAEAKARDYNINGLGVVSLNEINALNWLDKGSTLQQLGSGGSASDGYLAMITIQNKIIIRLLAKMIKKN